MTLRAQNRIPQNRPSSVKPDFCRSGLSQVKLCQTDIGKPHPGVGVSAKPQEYLHTTWSPYYDLGNRRQTDPNFCHLGLFPLHKTGFSSPLWCVTGPISQADAHPDAAVRFLADGNCFNSQIDLNFLQNRPQFSAKPVLCITRLDIYSVNRIAKPAKPALTL